jgi:hypothetical protein
LGPCGPAAAFDRALEAFEFAVDQSTDTLDTLALFGPFGLFRLFV